jgi:hypothetical protein
MAPGNQTNFPLLRSGADCGVRPYQVGMPVKKHDQFHISKRHSMQARYLPAALLALTMSLAGCSGNYTWSDSDYRPLGEPYPVKRGK